MKEDFIREYEAVNETAADWEDESNTRKVITERQAVETLISEFNLGHSSTVDQFMNAKI